MSPAALAAARHMAEKITGALGGRGLFGVEMFVRGEDVIFSEVSPRPHDTGLVTLISQDLSEFALHARAILGLPVPAIRQFGPSASCALLVEGESTQVTFSHLEAALAAGSGESGRDPAATARADDDPRNGIIAECAGTVTALDRAYRALADQTQALQQYTAGVCLKPQP